jgi:hypothetical protein
MTVTSSPTMFQLWRLRRLCRGSWLRRRWRCHLRRRGSDASGEFRAFNQAVGFAVDGIGQMRWLRRGGSGDALTDDRSRRRRRTFRYATPLLMAEAAARANDAHNWNYARRCSALTSLDFRPCILRFGLLNYQY